MNKILSILFLFVSLIVYAKDKPAEPFLLTAKTLQKYPNYLYENWKFSAADDSAMATLTFNDSDWPEVNPYMEFSTIANSNFKGIGWFRLHLLADSTVAGKPLALTFKHFGASEIYLDGKQIKSFGVIKGVDST